MKTTKFIFLMTLMVVASLVNAQNAKPTKWITDRCQKISAKITKDLMLSSADSLKFNEAIVLKFVYERENIKPDATPETKKEVYRVSMNQFTEQIKAAFPAPMTQKIQGWYKSNYQNFNSL